MPNGEKEMNMNMKYTRNDGSELMFIKNNDGMFIVVTWKEGRQLFRNVVKASDSKAVDALIDSLIADGKKQIADNG
jgi:hypothetical protein